MIQAFAAKVQKAPLEPFAYEPEALGPHDVEVAISHCGLCYSDIHLIDDDWKKSTYPLVPGHEIVGRVLRRGADVTHLEEGQRVGIGWQRSACLTCELCLRGNENLCPHQTATAIGQHGGLADRVVADARFAIPIPDGLESALAAPLFCGGVTVYAPMRRYGVSGTSSVGVIGIGGLGQMAIAILRAMGAEITAFSSSESKREEAMRMGAHAFVVSTDPKDVRKHAGRIDLLLSTVHAKLDWITYLQTLRPNGVLCLLGAPPGILQIAPAALLNQRSITTSEIGSRADIAALLGFAGRMKITPQTELAPMEACQAAVDRLRKNDVRYRMVLENR